MKNIFVLFSIVVSLFVGTLEAQAQDVKIPYIEGEIFNNPYGEDIVVVPTCLVENNSIILHVALDVDYQKYLGKGKTKYFSTTTVYQVSCNKYGNINTYKCKGAFLNITDSSVVDFGALVPLEPKDIKVVAQMNNFAIIKIGYKLFNINISEEKVIYTEASENVYGTGAASCEK